LFLVNTLFRFVGEPSLRPDSGWRGRQPCLYAIGAYLAVQYSTLRLKKALIATTDETELIGLIGLTFTWSAIQQDLQGKPSRRSSEFENT
jgi:hypothetical protein